MWPSTVPGCLSAFPCLCCLCHTAVIHQLAYALALDFPFLAEQENKFRLLFSLCVGACTPARLYIGVTCCNRGNPAVQVPCEFYTVEGAEAQRPRISLMDPYLTIGQYCEVVFVLMLIIFCKKKKKSSLLLEVPLF